MSFHWSGVKTDMLTPACQVHHWLTPGAPLTDTGSQSFMKKSTVSYSSLEFWEGDTLFFFFFVKMKRKQVLDSSRDVMLCARGCLVNLVNSFEMKLMGCLSTAAHHSVRKTTFGILAYLRDVQTFCDKGKPHSRSYFCSRSHMEIFQECLSHLSYASNEFGLYHHTVIFTLVKCCFLCRLHQVVRSSLHRVASSLQTHQLTVSMHPPVQQRP